MKLTRVIGTPALRGVDPFLMLDEFRSDEPQDYLAGFPDHPHRGFETITYMVAGRFRHRDNKGHQGLLEAGGAQWMTAGRGIVHSEMPEQEEGLVWGFQLWLNLPATDKMRAPEYRDLQPWDIPVAKLAGGVEARVLAGRVGETVGPIGDRATTPYYVDVSIPAGERVTLELPEALAGFVYPFEGGVSVGDRPLARGELGVLGEGQRVTLKAHGGPARALVVAGRPLREPVVQYGPFVMNTPEQLEEAVRDYRAGRF
ncbi:MAG: pirin family protein [Sandaracinaceae bacterium]|nr:pirin family protein [Sandaracinaceae bacterium]